MEFVECFVTIKSISNKINFECSVESDFSSHRYTFGNVDLKFLNNQKETIFSDVQCEFLEFVNQPNYLNTLHFKFVKFISEEWFYKTKKYLSNSRTGRIRIWNSKDGEKGIDICSISSPLSLNLSLQINEHIKLNKNLRLHLTGKYFEENDLSENYKKSQNYIFETLTWNT